MEKVYTTDPRGRHRRGGGSDCGGGGGGGPTSNKVLSILFLVALYLLARRWHDKSRAARPILQNFTPTEIAAIASLLGSLLLLLLPRLAALRRRD